MKSLLKTAVLSAMAATAVVAASAPSASAYIACNRWHQCWHTHARYAYPRGVGVAVYPDTWKWRGRGWRWTTDRDERGYWAHGRWRKF